MAAPKEDEKQPDIHIFSLPPPSGPGQLSSRNVRLCVGCVDCPCNLFRIIPAWSLKNKEAFRIGLMVRARVEP